MMKIQEVLIQIIKTTRIHLIVILMTKKLKMITVTLITLIWKNIRSGENKIQTPQIQAKMMNLKVLKTRRD